MGKKSTRMDTLWEQDKKRADQKEGEVGNYKDRTNCLGGML